MIKLKPSAEKLNAYFVNDLPYRIKLDANEGSNYLLKDGLKLDNIDVNIYPDSDCKALREKLAKYYDCEADNLLIGNGSSELISMVINAYCDKGDKVVSFVPSFSMYQTYCDLCGAEYVGIKTNEDFSQNIDTLIEKSLEINPKVVVLCNPNNPTGYVTERGDIIKLLESVKNSIIIVDEAYADFSGDSIIDLIDDYENLVVMRTMSKAFGLAGIRVGSMIANEELIKYIWKVKVPYNINVLSQIAAIKALDNIELVKEYISQIKILREKLSNNLKELKFTVYNSGSNYLFVQSSVDNLFEKLASCGILIRKFNFENKIYYRISVGKEEENKILVDEIRRLL